MKNFKLIKNQKIVVAVDGVSVPIIGQGTVCLNVDNNVVKLKNVMYSPHLRRNLISAACLDKEGAKFTGGNGKFKVTKQNKNLFTATLKDGVYRIFPSKTDKVKIVQKFDASVKGEEKNKNQAILWHRRLSHTHIDNIKRAYNNQSVKGLPKIVDSIKCESCKLNKQRRVSFSSLPETQSKRPLERVFMDTWGPTRVKGRGGEKYFLSITDDYSRKVSVYPIKSKDLVFKVFERHITRAERFLDTKLKSIRTDNGSEFLNRHFQKFCSDTGVKHELTNTYTPEQNGVAERFNRTLMDGVRTVLSESGLSESFWPEAALYYTYTHNRVCHAKQSLTPFELYSGTVPSVRHLKPFGCTAYVGVPKQQRKTKFQQKAVKGVLVGYAFSTKGYRVWIPDTNKIIETINVTFDENLFYSKNNNKKPNLSEIPSNSSGAVLDPFQSTLEFDPEPRQSGDDSLSEEGEGDSDTPSPSSETEEGESDDDRLKDVQWLRKPVERPNGSRTDIYYYEVGKNARIRSQHDAKKYCLKNKIKYEPHIFDFSQRNKYRGIVGGQRGSSSSSASSTQA